MAEPAETRSRKRKRTGEAEAKAEVEEVDEESASAISVSTDESIHHDEDLWFDDGNIVLVSEDAVAFRLHRGVLTRHSEIFRDMFMVAQPSDGERMEGCPVVRLQDGSRDLNYFLSALYDGRGNTYFNRDLPIMLEAISALLCLGCKYAVDHIRDEAIYRLRLCFPAALDDFDHNLWREHSKPPISDICPEDVIRIINLARKFDLPSLLPSAFYIACQLDNDDLVHGVSYESDIYEVLVSKDLLLVLNGRKQLLDANSRATAFLYTPTAAPDCKASGNCARTPMRTLLKNAQRDSLLAASDPLTPLAEWLERQAAQSRICPPCVSLLQTRYDNERKVIWDELGRMFGVEPWPIK